MGITFKTQQIGPWHTKINAPVKQGLEGWFTFDTDAKRFFFNRAKDKPDGVIVGAPVAYPTHGRFKGLANFIKTAIHETDGQTLVVVGRAVGQIPVDASTIGDANTPFYVGNYRGNSATEGVAGIAYGTSLYHVRPNSVTGGATRLGTNGTATSSVNTLSAGEVATDWGIRCLRSSSSMFTKVQNLTKNIMTQGTDPASRVLADSLFQIGSGSAAFGGEVDISAVAIYSRPLNEDELGAVAASMRKRMLRLGIVV
ncbi:MULTISPECIES: hypothetical protein [unclassified Pseudomonas]|uniref:hypothetical protein n=1 Tax=unclassified Pseudomonas TaxID=196821 RepID=UPI001AE94670|nr:MULTISPECIES: hypothetical protein [unclassified Pseudomonas]MBP2273760.1 hypothetical protein [Pseudomonas sp. BP6]MBP2287269.1 hypothetical protein [Pseudomonas sp. BP7]HDS1696333.1 hypothetical protein [Pseudomonas putida]HDS1703378.1 hypothetical protein [Pseudomonas putida]